MPKDNVTDSAAEAAAKEAADKVAAEAAAKEAAEKEAEEKAAADAAAEAAEKAAADATRSDGSEEPGEPEQPVEEACAELGIEPDGDGNVVLELLVSLAGEHVKSPGDSHNCEAAEAVRMVRAGFAKVRG